MTDHVTLQFSTTADLASGLIRFMCHSDFSHVDLILPDPPPFSCLGASDPGGVMRRPHNYYKMTRMQRATIKTDKANRIIELVNSQLGKPFDSGAMRAVMGSEPRDWKLPDMWFCSELVAWALEESGFIRIVMPKNRMTPNDLLLLLNNYIDPEEFHRDLVERKE